MGTFLAGLRARRWLNVGVFALGVLALVVAVATPLYARSSAEHLLDQRTLERANTETGLNVEVGPVATNHAGTYVPIGVVWTGGADREKHRAKNPEPTPLTDADRQQMLGLATDMVDKDVASRFWRPATTYLLSKGSLRVGAVDHDINAYWREGMCEQAHVEGRCPSAPDEALVD